MAYDRATIVEQVRSNLSRNPGASKTQIAEAIRVERHVMVRGLIEAGHSFESIHSEVRLELLHTLRRQRGVMSKKEVMDALGFRTYRSLARWWSRRSS